MIDEAVLQELVDKEAIRSVLYRYCRAVDRGDAELLATVYHPDATDNHGAYVGPAAGFIEWAVRNGGVLFETIQHSLGTIIIQIEGDVAYSEAYFSSPGVMKPGEDGTRMLANLTGRYIDRFECRQGEWRIAQRVVVKDFRHVQPLNDTFDDKYVLAQRGKSDLVYRHDEA
jgi:hypothetical protein